MAAGTYVQVQVLRQGRTNLDGITAAAGCSNGVILRMNFGFHNSYLLVLNQARSVTEAYAPATVVRTFP